MSVQDAQKKRSGCRKKPLGGGARSQRTVRGTTLRKLYAGAADEELGAGYFEVVTLHRTRRPNPSPLGAPIRYQIYDEYDGYTAEVRS
jgi:hypothetical protein